MHCKQQEGGARLWVSGFVQWIRDKGVMQVGDINLRRSGFEVTAVAYLNSCKVVLGLTVRISSGISTGKEDTWDRGRKLHGINRAKTPEHAEP